MIYEVFPLATCDTDCEKGIRITAITLNSPGELGWVWTAMTRHEPLPGDSVATSLSLTVLAVHTHPSSGQADCPAL